MSGPTPIPACTEPLSPRDAFQARRTKGLFWLERRSAASCPRGLNIDGCIIIDMRADGRVEGIEMLVRAGGALREPDSSEPVHALYLGDTPNDLSAEDAALTLDEKGRTRIRWIFGAPAAAQRYALGGGAFAEIADGRLTALGLEFAS